MARILTSTAITEAVKNFAGTGESNENKQALQGVEGDKDVPEGLLVHKSGRQTNDPSQAHDNGQPHVQVKIGSRPTRGGHFGCALCRVKNHTSTKDE